MAGVKHDNDKLRLDLIPIELYQGLGNALTFGATKYGDKNWEEGMAWNRVYGALLRHITAWWAGENTDPESGLSHLDHVLACATFLKAYESRGVGEDNRC